MGYVLEGRYLWHSRDIRYEISFMLQGFWRSPGTAMHYIGILKEVVGDEFVAALDNYPDLRAQLSQQPDRQRL